MVDAAVSMAMGVPFPIVGDTCIIGVTNEDLLSGAIALLIPHGTAPISLITRLDLLEFAAQRGGRQA
jgi:hypothetical protein